MIKTQHAGHHDADAIERRLAEALRGQRPLQPEPEAVDTADFTSRELLQMAWDRAEAELDELQTELRRMRQRHQESERALLTRVNEKKRLQRELLERAGNDSPTVYASSNV